ncbi:DUF4221 family protein [Algoriphagus aquimarinus]|uniref:DUF4221 domain-containing protein n=1 Tax=Algoriphagus aquimarinus TaxID=237018 RepID=A0A5C7B2R8_9BACT|nr:DUF4221 family protein [Algoriphagus aquimarinus]TXE14039.1 DUF4221 domain-containing protein [Algoriphagus aquimarinus]
MTKLYKLVFIVAIISCNPKNVTNEINTYTFETLKIPIKENFVPSITRNQYLDSDSGEYLALYSKTSQRLEFFNLETKQSSKSIKIDREGPNGVGSFNGFTIASLDCLLLASIPPKIQVLDFSGNKKRSIPVNDPKNKVNWLGSTNLVPFLFKGDTLFGSQPFFSDIFKTSKGEAKQSTPFFYMNLSLEKPEVAWLDINRPEDEWDKGKKDPNLSWADRYDSIIVSPLSDHRLWIISKNKRKLLGYKEARSSHLNQFNILKDYPVGDQGMIRALEAGRYEILLNDHYRDVFYRFFFAGIKLENYNLTPRELFTNKPRVGVLVLNKDLDIIGEHLFEDHAVENWNYFVGKKGLYVSTNNPNRDDFDENFLRYDIIRFEGLEYED